MGGELHVKADDVFATAHAVSNDAEELRDELNRIQHEWDNLSRGWSGAAATAYTAIWEEWHRGAVTLVDVLADMSTKLGRAAVAYDEQDGASADAVSTTVELGL
jgi:WXG100 family type VII secretion target